MATEPAIIAEGLHFAYPPLSPGGPPVSVLKGLDLGVEEGEFLGLMGPTGCGKTTLCLALIGLVPQATGGDFDGRLIVTGLDTCDHSVAELSTRVGLVFQDAESQLFNMTVEDEVAFGLESLGVPRGEMLDRIAWALNVVRLEDLRDRSTVHLSGGQKKRLAIAAVLAMQPRVLVLDEPLAGLDPVGKFEVLSVVEKLKQEMAMTIVMVEQQAEAIAAFADRVAVLHDGHITMAGTPRDIFSQVEAMRSLGLAVPQVSELAWLLNRDYDADLAFITEEEARESLMALLAAS